jgi:hypothetical protein
MSKNAKIGERLMASFFGPGAGADCWCDLVDAAKNGLVALSQVGAAVNRLDAQISRLQKPSGRRDGRY